MRHSAGSRCILVLGMHRSGTSALTGVLDSLGIGPPHGKLISAEQDNARGYFELSDVNDFNEQLLAAFDSGWADWSPINSNWPPPTETARVEAMIERIRGWYSDRQIVALKDPRICRMVPLWRRLLDDAHVVPLAVIPYRDPLSVAASLNARDGFPEHMGFLLWLRHALDAEAATRDLTRSFVSYDSLMRDWRTAAEKIGRELGLRWPRPIDAATKSIEAFLSWDEWHHRFDMAALGSRKDIPPDIKEGLIAALRALDVLADHPYDRAAQSELDAIRQSCDSRLEKEDAILSRYMRALWSRNTLLKRKSAELYASKYELEETKVEFERTKTEFERTKVQLERNLDAISRMRASYSWRITAPLRKAYDFLQRHVLRHQ